ncbi:hypothetical protein BDR26DRAFT_179385 [Obelidium mucronatum]|nr:hypothetical protein BDR26DRAFT_179385 [Obelidium mucronatum]
MTPDALAEDISERMRAPSSVAQQKQSTPVEHTVLAVEAEGREGELTIMNSFQELIHKSRINTVPEMLKHHTVVRPKSPFIQPSKNSKDDISFEKFEALSDAAMNIIADSFGNIVAGSSPPVVSIMAGTSYEAMIITMAVWKLGWTTAMLNPKASVDLLIRQAQAVSSAALISVDKRDLSNAATVSETLAIPLLMTDSNVLLTPPRISESETAKILAVKLPLKPDTPLCFLFSSSSVDGTSIKAARLSHGQVLENCKMRDMLWNSPYTTTTSKVLTWLPFSHVMGLIVDFVNNGLVAGMTLCLRPSREHPATPEFLLDDVIAVKPSLMYTVPWVLDSWVSKFDTNQNSGNHVDMSTAVSVLRGMNALIAGGAPLKPETRKFLVSRGIHILEGMGATEAAGTIFTGLLKPASSSAQDEEGWMTPLPGFTIVLEPTEGWPNENMGMLAISAPSISKHVVSARSGETCLDLIPRNLLVDGGLFRTGDIFEKRIVVLGEGSELTEYRFVSRADDAVMLSTGFAVAPSMLEESLVAEFSDVSCACLLADFRSIPHLILKMNENGALRSNIDTLKMISACIRRCAPELQIDGSRLIVVGPDFVMPMSPKNTILRGRLRSTLFNNR